jgi:hypothetical protein
LLRLEGEGCCWWCPATSTLCGSGEASMNPAP